MEGSQPSLQPALAYNILYKSVVRNIFYLSGTIYLGDTTSLY